MQGTIRLIAFSLASAVLLPLYGVDHAPQATNALAQSSVQFPALLAALDSFEYQSRRAAAGSLALFLEVPYHRDSATAYLKGMSPGTLSFEARRQLTALGILPFHGTASSFDKQDLLPSEIASLVKELSSDQYRQRQMVLEQLQAAAHNTASIHRVYPALKRAVAEMEFSTGARLLLTSVLETARYTWLVDSSNGHGEAPSADQVERWIDALVSQREGNSKAAADRVNAPRRTAKRDAAEWELLDALALDATAPSVQRALAQRMSRGELDDDAARRVRRLEETSRHGLAAEYWQRRHNLTIQYFVVGVPSQAPGALRPTQFDRVSDDLARCTSGNALQPGDYPLGVAFPHPREQAAFFHLVSLRGARERLVYQYESEALTDDERLQRITERTLGPAVVNKRPLDEAQLWLLGQLDQAAVARMLRSYFAEVPDEPFDLSQLAPMLTDVSSIHRAACLMLALDGSPEVVPALVEAAEKKRFLRLATDEPQALAWIAALAIAEREPWDGVDAWLAGLIERMDSIAFGQGRDGDVGATAAALLLARSGEPTSDFGLVEREPLRRGLHDRFEAPINADYRRRMFEDRMFKQLGVTPFYFAEPDGRTAVVTWWNRRQALRSASPIPKKQAPSPAYTARASRP